MKNDEDLPANDENLPTNNQNNDLNVEINQIPKDNTDLNSASNKNTSPEKIKDSSKKSGKIN